MNKEIKNMGKRAKDRGLGSKNSYASMLRTEKGLALVTVLVLSLITLAIISTLIYLVIQGTRVSGSFKRYGTAREAAVGGSELGADFISDRGTMVIPGLLNIPNSCDCGDPDDPNDNLYGGAPSCLCDKLCDTAITYPGAVLNWVHCGANDISLDPTNNPDMQFTLPGVGGINYQVSVKIVDTIRGNSDLSGEALGGTAVSSSTSGIISAPPLPYLHRVEISSVPTGGNLEERSRLSALYAY